MKYPTRCRIIDVDGERQGDFILRTPEVSRPHIGVEGVAHKKDGEVIIWLDNGAMLRGSECWWEPIPEEPSKF